MINSFLPIFVGSILLALSTSFLGSLIIWNRMTSFGDTISHSSMLGLSLGIFFHIDPFYSVLIVSLLLTIIILIFEKYSTLSINTLLSIMSHFFLSLGIILMSILSGIRKINISSYLFGDLISINFFDLTAIFFSTVIVLSFVIFRWKNMLSTIVNYELATLDGVNVFKERLILMFLVAFTISLLVKLFGVLIINSLLIIPSSSVQRFSKSPENMVFFSIIISILCILIGLFFSRKYNLPISPSIVLCSSLFFILGFFKKQN
ncbi:metal ABC transporter permease [Buchnera aphidicola (Taiwanaphis decaspermi)]|uniref:metal ABC transporter permease n=1 Tax=Buchnera aphidicola TaxID=9 RepID=UPI0031B8A027